MHTLACHPLSTFLLHHDTTGAAGATFLLENSKGQGPVSRNFQQQSRPGTHIGEVLHIQEVLPFRQASIFLDPPYSLLDGTERPYLWPHMSHLETQTRGEKLEEAFPEASRSLRKLEQQASGILLHQVQEYLLMCCSCAANVLPVQEYLRLGAGIDSLRIPSLCLYTKISVDWERAKQVHTLSICVHAHICLRRLGNALENLCAGQVEGEAMFLHAHKLNPFKRRLHVCTCRAVPASHRSSAHFENSRAEKATPGSCGPGANNHN
jgi:hypothetical protein